MSFLLFILLSFHPLFLSSFLFSCFSVSRLQPGDSSFSEQYQDGHTYPRSLPHTFLSAIHTFLHALLHPAPPLCVPLPRRVLHQPAGLHQDHQHLHGPGAPPAGVRDICLGVQPVQLGLRPGRLWSSISRGRRGGAGLHSRSRRAGSRTANEEAGLSLPPALHPAQLALLQVCLLHHHMPRFSVQSTQRRPPVLWRLPRLQTSSHHS